MEDNSPAEVTIKLPAEIFSSLIEQQRRSSDVLDISIVQEGSSKEKKFEICFPVDETFDSKSCLGYIDETRDPPEWRCEDRCVKKNNDGLVCGKTNHFTNFAILLSGVEGGCDESEDYVTGSYYGDLIMVACFVGVMILICCIVIGIATFSNRISRAVYGDEGHRIRTLRKARDETNRVTNDDEEELGGLVAEDEL